MNKLKHCVKYTFEQVFQNNNEEQTNVTCTFENIKQIEAILTLINIDYRLYIQHNSDDSVVMYLNNNVNPKNKLYLTEVIGYVKGSHRKSSSNITDYTIDSYKLEEQAKNIDSHIWW